MTTDIASLASPIDALYRIHNALRTEAERAEQTVEHLEVGSSFKAFYPVFYHWALVLSTYVEAEERADDWQCKRCALCANRLYPEREERSRLWRGDGACGRSSS